MEKFDLFREIAERTGGDIYIGIVGPVRTGKSTFIKRFMDLLVIPNIKNAYDRSRATDELPISGAGRTITTTEPKFVPNEAVEVTVGENITLRIRLVDCVGYAVEGALGYEDGGAPRRVVTPWSAAEMSFQEAAEIGTRKVITEHSTIGLVIATDGSITEIPRGNYVAAEERVIEELRELGKPFLVILNSVHPHHPETQSLAEVLQEKYGLPVLPIDCAQMGHGEIELIFKELLSMFPLREINIEFPKWVEALEPGHWLRLRFEEAIREAILPVQRMRDLDAAVDRLRTQDFIQAAELPRIAMGEGAAWIELRTGQDLFYRVLGELSGLVITGDEDLLKLLREMAQAKRIYEKVAAALAEVETTGYGVVMPGPDEITFAEPELMRHGHRFGVRLRASAPSIHMIRAEIMTEVTPVVGTERQGEQFIHFLSEEFAKDPGRIWQSDFLGRSLHELVTEGIRNKLQKMPPQARTKLQEALTKIVNEGSGGLICIIL
ncbi:MAG: stage IV sporulation protein A [Firmicutes bacterium]|nr:stage IV sporulation protein A [Bacillota bacterium]